ncbi:Phthiocerol synthesis polyketide synthase type I PpsC [Rhizobium sp. CECT 9324]|nr:Phthiocerol synthesis polyketide synthase type I PpsC [Rhizobium sp. CECT 9324]
MPSVIPQDSQFSIPQTMTAIEISKPGGPDVLQITTRGVPKPANNELLIHVLAAGINGPDVLQRKGLYDPPPGASDIPGLEIAGQVVALGASVSRFAVGDMVAALVTGGGYAEYAVANENVTFAVPKGLTVTEAAALPETFMTVWLNLFQRGKFGQGDSVLIHGGASGIGTTATMLARQLGADKIITTVNSAAQQEASVRLGADVAVNYLTDDFVSAAKDATGGAGVDVILDIIAGDYVARNYEAAAMNGRIMQVSILKGPAKELNLWPMLVKRLTHAGSTLRSQSYEDKKSILGELEKFVWPLIAEGRVKPEVYRTFPLIDAADAHMLIDSGTHIGKIVLVN